MRVVENFCQRAGINWQGGVGIGGGVMLNVTRVILMVQAAIFFALYLISGIQTGKFWNTGYLAAFLPNAGVFLFLNAGVISFLLLMGLHINKASFFGKHYTRILIPSLVFVPCANVFFFILSLFQGGLFRGWLAKK